uniref:Gfo/Idh/MocA family protein n=1 Tax=Ningiella ruwaisensis TaxID=2364274 RepID=UPI0010A08C7D|nr:Gfo/Idh/MocA family oxidoreductase [Ningiella ruwaisensis]
MANFNRRQFLRYSSSLIALSALGQVNLLSAAPKKKVGVALVGLGNYSENLLAPALQSTQFCELKGIVTGTPSKIPKWQARYGIEDKNVYSYETMHEAANNPDIDVMYIVTPTGVHMKYSLIAANAGKHVWCEKPMAMNVEECQRIIDTCNKNKVKLSIGYRMQHEPNTMRFGEYATSKPFGNFTSVYTRAGYAGNGFPQDYWRMKKDMGGGAMYDMGVYPLNGARYLTKLEPIAISATHEKSHPHIFKEVDETTFFTLEFPNGLMADCGTSIVKSFNKARIECESGWYELDPMSQYSGVTGITSTGENYPPINGMQQTLQMDNDALAILQDSPVLVPGIDGLRDIHVVEAAFRSAAQDGKRILL